MKGCQGFLLMLLAILPVGSSAAPQEVAPAKAGDIRRLLEVTGAKEMAVRIATEFLKVVTPLAKESIEKSMPPDKRSQEIVDLLVESFNSKLLARMSAELVELSVPTYDKYLTREDIQEAIRFYESPAGRRLIQATPQIMQENMAKGQEWGAKVVPEISQEVINEIIRRGF